MLNTFFDVRNLPALMHFDNGVASGVGAAIGYLLTRSLYQQPVDPLIAVMVLLVTLCISSAGFIINDIRDVEIDRINRPERPLPAGQFTIRQAWIVLIVLTVIGIALSAAINTSSLLMVLFLCAVLLSYSLIFKRMLLIGHAAVALSGALVLPYGGVVAENLIPTIYLLPVAFFAFMGREILKTMPDVVGDATHKVDNIATHFGTHTAAIASIGFIGLAAVLLSLLPTYWHMNSLYFPAILFLVYPFTGLLISLIWRYEAHMNRAIKLSKLIFLLVLLPIIIGSINI
jgi:geranylgeranylglycerol-phosphate geranylgeranyltransferase